jgi:hypothetical protein
LAIVGTSEVERSAAPYFKPVFLEYALNANQLVRLCARGILYPIQKSHHDSQIAILNLQNANRGGSIAVFICPSVAHAYSNLLL